MRPTSSALSCGPLSLDPISGAHMGKAAASLRYPRFVDRPKSTGRGVMIKQILFAMFLLSPQAHAYAQTPLLWELQEDILGGTDMARAITLSGRRAVVLGNGGVPLEGTDGSDFVIQALSRANG